MTPTAKESGAGQGPAVALVNGLLLSLILGAVTWCGYSVSQHKSHLVVRIAPAIAILIGLPILFLFKPVARFLAASILIGFGTGVYLAEALAVMLVDPDRPALQAMGKAAKQDGVVFDERDRIEVLSDMRRRNIKAYPPFYPYLLLNSLLTIDGHPALPVGDIAHAFTVCCNEGGQYSTYTTDEYGFPNPAGSWSNAPIDVALIGASSATSECVPYPDSLVAQLRQRYPKTMTLGAGGNGPLLELASIREYLPVLKPRYVLWLFGESHTPEYLEAEAHSELLLRYFDPSFRQGLYGEQSSIDQAVAGYFESGIAAEQAKRTMAHKVWDFAILKDFRMLMYYFVTAHAAKPQPHEFAVAVYERALREGKKTIAAWGGNLAIVYWPDSARYPGVANYSPALRQTFDRTHDIVVNTAGKLAIPVIDLSRSFSDGKASETGANTPYFYPYPAHFKPAGYRFAGSEIVSAMGKASMMPAQEKNQP